MSKKSKAKWKVVLNIVTIIALFGAIYALRHQIVDSLNNLGKVDTWALFLVIPLQLLNYHAYTNQSRSLFSILGEKLRYRPMFRLMLEMNFVGLVFPSGGVTGLSYFGIRMKDADVSTAKTSLVYLMRYIMVFISFQILLGTGLLLLALDGKASRFVLLVGGSLSTLILVGTAGIVFIIGSKYRINRFFVAVSQALNKVIYVVRPRHPETINIEKVRNLFNELHEDYLLIKNDFSALKMPLIWSLLALSAEIATIYVVYVAFGAWVNPGAVILAYAVATIAGFFSVLPGGIGIYEALMTAVLAASGVSPGVSIPVTVMYRVLAISVQIPPGFYFYNKNIRSKTTSS
ncbi:MAG: lysylphosphatidylglycerol synthase transmembrane domain-containing protein [Candidatus Saccharibacteria bacterium]|nr:lysylphosphatidylglycerol synthase transmembrane domain-containing protein [Candidatus Saccharibacteria bacterium]